MTLRPHSYIEYTDEELLALIGDNSAIAFDELYRRYAQKMFSYFFRMLWKNKELAEDFTHDLFLKLIRHAKGFETGRSCSAWIYSIAHNMCKNEYRKEVVRVNYSTLAKGKDESADHKNMDLKNFKEAVRVYTEALDEEKKSLFILRFQEQLTVPDISRILDIPEGTVKSRIFYLLKEMKERLKHFEILSTYP
jgi:RNA polymerase sigma-70 factor (ECF subfamily)